jgi:signal transduction histidine kinase
LDVTKPAGHIIIRVTMTAKMPDKKIKILHLEDLPSDAEMVERELKKSNLPFETRIAKNKKEYINTLENFAPDVILSDHSLPSFDSISALKILKKSAHKIPFILVTATMPDEGALDVVKEGADDYILKDRLSRLPVAILNCLEKFRLAETAVKLEHDIAMKEMHLANAIVEAKELERSELGKELHDNVNQLLGAAKLYIEMAKKDPDNRDRFLLESSQHTHKAIEEIKKLSKGLVSSVIGDVGLCEVIKNIVTDIMTVHKVDISFECEKIDDLNDKLSLNIFRIVQEQLNNIIKHAEASKIEIDISRKPNKLLLSIKDNGIGFDTSKKYSGIGINNIISRAELYKGKAAFLSQPAKGCELVVTIPIEKTFKRI